MQTHSVSTNLQELLYEVQRTQGMFPFDFRASWVTLAVLGFSYVSHVLVHAVDLYQKLKILVCAWNNGQAHILWSQQSNGMILCYSICIAS